MKEYVCPKCGYGEISSLPICHKCGYIYQDFGLSDFLDKNINLITAFGVFIALSIYIFTQNSQDYNSSTIILYFVSFIIAFFLLIVFFIKIMVYEFDWGACNYKKEIITVLVTKEREVKDLEYSRIKFVFAQIPLAILSSLVIFLMFAVLIPLISLINQNQDILPTYNLIKSMFLIGILYIVSFFIISYLFAKFIENKKVLKWFTIILIIVGLIWIVNLIFSTSSITTASTNIIGINLLVPLILIFGIGKFNFSPRDYESFRILIKNMEEEKKEKE
jgi:hypothetical protein